MPLMSSIQDNNKPSRMVSFSKPVSTKNKEPETLASVIMAQSHALLVLCALLKLPVSYPR